MAGTGADVTAAAPRPDTGGATHYRAPDASQTLNLDFSPGGRSAGRWYVRADSTLVIGRGGRPRALLVVPCCPGCGSSHLHLGAPQFASGRRTAPCGVKYLLRVEVPS